MSPQHPSRRPDLIQVASGESGTNSSEDISLAYVDEDALVMGMVSELPDSILEVLAVLETDEARRVLKLESPVRQFFVHDMSDWDRLFFLNEWDEDVKFKVLMAWVRKRMFSKISAFSEESVRLIEAQIDELIEKARKKRADREILRQLVEDEDDSATLVSRPVPGLKYDKSSRRLTRDGQKYRHVDVTLTPNEAQLFEAICKAGPAGLSTASFRVLTNSSPGSQDQNKANLARKLGALDVTIPSARVTHVYSLRDLAQQDR